MESRSAEPLQSLSVQQQQQQQNARRRRPPDNNNAFKKKKKWRRRRRRTPKSVAGVREAGSVTLSPGTSREPWAPQGSPAPVLRPVGPQVPCAPQNSTQFIMDDHENSTLFVNFDNFSTPHWEQEPPLSGAEEEEAGSATPTHALTRDWFPFNAADFETAYQSAREDRLMAGSSQDLRKAIMALEARAAVLTEVVSASPGRLLATLQAHLLHLQEENATLRLRLARRRRPAGRSSSSSSTGSDSESDSTNSSSDCSESDCDTCAARRGRVGLGEEEKENTCPSPPPTA